MLELRDEIKSALSATPFGGGVVALETAVLTHGLPYPINLQTVMAMQNAVRQSGAIPAVVGVIEGKFIVGLTDDEIAHLAKRDTKTAKLSSRDLAWACATNSDGGTTVAGTLVACRLAGIRAFATGGIGGVHRGWANTLDISADLDELMRSPCCVICSGAKSILDLPATLEALESRGVPVLAFGTDYFPQFYSRGDDSLPTPHRTDSITITANLCNNHWYDLHLNSAIILANPVPQESAIPHDEIESAIKQAITQAEEAGVTGRALTPFLLERVSQLTQGNSMRANLALLESNAKMAGKLAVQLTQKQH